MKNNMTAAWWRAVSSVAGIAVVLAAACGGSYSPPNEGAARSAAQTQTGTRVTEKAFAAGGKIDMQLGAGGYTVRAARDNVIRVTLGDKATATVDVSTQGTQANVVVKDTSRQNFQATVELPQAADLVIRLAAGELTIESIAGSKDVESNAGNVDIVTGDSNDYASVDASVQAGDIKAEPFGESRSGLFSKLSWSGKGKYTLRARLIAGNLTLRSK